MKPKSWKKERKDKPNTPDPRKMRKARDKVRKEKENIKERTRANMVAGFRGNPMVVEKED